MEVREGIMTDYLDEKSPVSLYHQLKEVLLQRITDKEWKYGEKIPTEFELCRRYNVSRITVRQALAELEKEGFLIRKQGRGTYVSVPKIEQNLTSIYSFSEEFRKKGFTPRNKILEFHDMPPEAGIMEKLKIEGCEHIYYIKRLRYADDILMAIESTYLPADMFPGMDRKELDEKRLYDVMRDRYGVAPSSAEEIFGAVLIDEKEAEFFGIKKGSAGLEIQRYTYSGLRCIEYTRGVARGDKFSFHVKLF